ncbi:MAG: carboxypeptidase-like regulatory domain-containing protein, partial [Nannocystaceae bacterium]|nr:carboxypeptidase-like regulatory domain-containing protein [Nannocystaceae bacterium]
MARSTSHLRRWLVLLSVGLVIAVAWAMLASGSPSGSASPKEPSSRPAMVKRALRPTVRRDDEPFAAANRFSVCGSVIAGGSRAAVPGAVVSLRPRAVRGANTMLVPGGGRRSLLARTDSEGRWTVHDVPMSAGRAWSVAVTADGFRPQIVPASGDCDQGPLTVQLEPGGEVLHGTVRDATGGALADATVHLVASAGPSDGAEQDAALSTSSGDDGRYRISVDPGVYRVVARFPDYAEEGRWVRVEATTQQDFALLPGGRVEGTVVRGEGGEPVAFAHVVTTPSAGLPTTGGEAAAVTDADGRFVIDGIDPGELELHAHAESGRTASGTLVELGPGGYKTGIELRLAAAPAAYGVVVLRSDDSVPVEGATVLARSGGGIWVSKPTDPSGGFVLPSLAPGEYQVSVEAPAHVPNHLAATLRVADGDVEGLVLEVDAGTSISGQVVEGGPDTSVRVEVDLEGLPPALGMPLIGNAFVSTRCDAEGRFQLGPVTAGELTLVAEDPTRGTGRTSATVTLDDDPAVVIELSAATGIEGRVFDAGEPREGLTIAAVRLDRPASIVPPAARVSASQASVLTGADGSFRHAGLEPGTYHVRVLDASSILSVEGEPPVVEVQTGTWSSVTLDLADRSGVLTGQVVDADGSPVADAVV